MARAAVSAWSALFLLNTITSEAQEPTTTSQPPLTSNEEPQKSFVAFLTTAEDGMFGVVCTAAIVHQSYVLTAAGCFLTSRGETISYHHKVLAGNEYKDIQQLLPHPAYILQTNYYDVGLIKLWDSIRFHPAVGKAWLADTDDGEVGDDMKTTCWLMSENRSSLEEESTVIIPREKCGRAPLLGQYSTPHMLCASVQNNCVVDIGGPLYTYGKLLGVASRHHNGRTTYTKVFPVRNWIVNVIYKDNMAQYFNL